jgi:hypothetical protein
VTEQELVDKIAELEEANARLNRIATDRLYMIEAYRAMLGKTGMKVAKMWDAKRVQRVHFNWQTRGLALTGEKRAQVILDWEAAPRTEMTSIDSHLAPAPQPGGK